VRRYLFLVLGWLALIIGFIGMAVPLLPTVVFWIFAAFCFSRSSPRFERWLLRHRTVGPHILAWRQRRAISRKGKIAASLALAGSSVIGLVALGGLLALLPLAICLGVAGFIWTRPD
jgi:hypothetical protein